MPHTLADAASLAADPAARADDLHRAFADPDTVGVVSTIGGDDSIRVVRHLDLEVLAANPKVFLGSSDSTITQMALLRAGVTSFYSPSIMSGFAEYGGLHDALVEGARRTLFEPDAPYRWPENQGGWTVEHLDWSTPAWWPSLDGAVLVLETSEDQPPPVAVTSLLRSLAATGELHRLSGLVFARPGGADLPVDEHVVDDHAILRVVRDEEGLVELPVATNVDLGHTDPIWTVPQGVRIRLDPAAAEITFLEPAVT